MQDRETRIVIKKTLIYTNIVLVGLLISILVFETFVLRSQQISLAKELNQYALIDLQNLSLTSTASSIYSSKSQNKPLIKKYIPKDTAQTLKKHDITSSAIKTTANDKDSKNVSEISEPLLQLLDKKSANQEDQSKKCDEANLAAPKVYESIIDASKEVLPLKGVTIKAEVSPLPKIAIIVTNLGINKLSTELALTLPKEIGLGFVPHTSGLKHLLKQAISDGHEIYLYLPFETKNNQGQIAYNDCLISSEHIIDENLKRLALILTSQEQYNGLYTPYHQIFSTAPESRNVLQHIINSNLPIVMSNLDKDSDLTSLPNITEANLLLDPEADENIIKNNLKKLILSAKKNKIALGYSQGYLLSINMIKKWSAALKNQGVELVHISSLK